MRWFERLAWAGWLAFAAAGVWAVPSQPPLVPEGEVFDDFESLVAAVSRRPGFHSIAFSRDGETLASGSDDAIVRLWDVGTGTEIRRFEGHYGRVWGVAFSPDGKTVASGGSDDDTVYLWAVAAGTEILRLKEDSFWWIWAVTFSPDGKTLASSSRDGTVRLWDVESGTEIRRFEDSDSAVAFSPDGKTVASGSALWDVESGTEIHRLERHSDELWLDEVWSVAFSPDGKTLATGSTDGPVWLWDVGSGTQIRSFGEHSVGFRAVTFSPDGKTLATGSDDGTVQLWGVESGTEIHRVEGHWFGVVAVAFSPDGKTLAAAGDAAVMLLDVGSGIQIRRFGGHSSEVSAVALSSDGKTLAAGSDDGTMRLWDVGSGTEICSFETLFYRAVAFSPDGNTLASGSWDGKVRLWDVGSGTEIRNLEEDSDRASAVAFSPDGKTLASGSEYGPVRLWDVGSGTEIRTFEGDSEEILALAFSPDGKTLASGSEYGPVRLWDVGSGTEIRSFEEYSAEWKEVMAVAFSPDGKTLATGSDSGTVRLWSVGSGTEIRTFGGHSDGVSTLAFNPDGTILVSGSYDGTVRLWSQGKDTEYHNSQVFLGGQRGTWIGCRSAGICLRHDDGTLLVRKNDQGRFAPLAPPSDGSPELEMVTVPATLETTDGSATPFTLKVRNNGTGRAFWINVRSATESESEPLVFHPPPTQVVLDSGDEAELACRVSTHYAYENPRDQSVFLALEVTSAHSEPIVVEPILIQGKIPTLEWVEARCSQDGEEVILSISLTNAGEQDLSLSEFSAELIGFEKTPGTVRQEIPAGERVTIPFSIPGDFEADEGVRVTLVARKLEHPIHEWTFADKTVLMPRALWPLYLALTLFLLGTGLGVAAFQHYRHPLVTQLSDFPKALVTLAPEQLRPAGRLLRRIRRLDFILAAADVHSTWLDAAIAFTIDPDPESRCRRLSERLGVRPEGPHAGDPALWTLPIGPSFPLNLERCFLYLPPADRPPADVGTTLRQRPETHDQVTLVVSADPGHQEKLHRSASDPGNLWVAPSGAQLTSLLLAADPVESLARLVASQVRLTRISPYQTGGGTNKASMFFGRQGILAHILNRESANYLVVGGRQLGKSSLLKAIGRTFGNRPDARCHYLVLRGSDLAGDLARAVGLSREAGLDEVVAHLTAEDRGRRLLLIDEADRFIRAERTRDYPTLQHLRALSELGRCHFILAGFWDLYEAVAFDYQSPLRNFGETLTIGALEADACRALATRPMATMSLGYESPELVERLVAATGQRANLVSIACNEILKNLDPKDRTIHAADVDRALAGKAIHNALGGWKNLAGDDAGNRLDRILVYATIRRHPFTLADALRILEEQGENVPPDQVERSLERLELAFVLGREENRYRYQVPLFEKMVQAQEPEVLLERELA